MSENDTVIVGVDPSTKSGVVALNLNGKLLDSKHLLFVDKKGCNRLHLIAQSIGSILDSYQVRAASIEGLGFANKFTKVEMAEIGGIIRLEFWKRGIPWWNVPPKVLKKWTTGHGNALKSDMAKAVKEKWGFTSKSDDVIDAYALGQIGITAELSGTEGLKGVFKFTN